MLRAAHQLLVLGQLLLSACLIPTASAQTVAEIANLEHFWSYGRSPAVIPSPRGSGTGDWADAYSKASALVARMTNEEKQNVTVGYASATNGCSGNSGGAPRVGFPGLCLNDAGNGVRGTDMVNAYASGLHVGAAWNSELAYNRGQFMGAEFKAKGVNVALGPVVGPLGRVAEGGRNWEGFSSDPYLCGQLAGQTVRGMQESVIASVKHFIAYEQETNRNPSGNNASVSSNLDDKTLHELYLWPFQDAVYNGAGCIMCSYNRVNNSYACQNSKALNGLLKMELDFQGDWGAQHVGVASAQAGLDMAMPNSVYWEDQLAPAVKNGSLAQGRLNDMATRIVAAWYQLAPFAHPGAGIPLSLTAPHEIVDARNSTSRSTIFQGAVEGHVLVKNINGTLPLKSPKMLSLFGYDAVAPLVNNPPAYGSFGKWTFDFESVNVSDIGSIAIFEGAAPQAALDGTIIAGGGSGGNSPSYINAPYDAFQDQAWQDGTWLAYDFENVDPVVEGASDACIVFINEFASEGSDRPGLADPYSDTLVQNVASQCNNTIVVIHNAGIRIVDAWINNGNITAVIFAHLPGQDSGRSLVEVMYGNQSPSGRLPYTVAKKASDYGILLAPTVPTATSDYYTQSNFTEGVYIDYRHFLLHSIEPRYPFGYGLTYTTFSYSSLRVALISSAQLTSTPPATPIQQGGNPSLWDVIATVDCTVNNTGLYAASEVAQLYVGIPGGPGKVLRGFNKQPMAPGQSMDMHFDLTRRDLSTWDTDSQSWLLQKGTYRIHVGASVLDIRLTGSLTI